MGLCQSDNSEEAIKNKQLQKQLAKDFEKDNQVYKLLLLGAGESGKSTLFKQMMIIHGVGYSEDDRKGYTKVVHQNVLQSMKILCENADNLGIPIDESLLPSKEWIMGIRMDEEAQVTPEVAQHVLALWLDNGIKETYKRRAQFQLFDSAAFFLDKVLDIGSEAYIPSAQDVLRSRVRTTGIVEQEFEIEDNTFRMFDVGGQRNERKKWIHCFEDVTAVLFVAALSEYDQMLFEDESTNRMDEALALFKEISHSKWFVNSSMILFLNKKDLFKDKLAEVPLEKHIPQYANWCKEELGGMPASEEDNYEAACGFMTELFTSMSKMDVYSHVTCATDTNNVKHIFNSVKDTIIRKSLQEGGLLA